MHDKLPQVHAELLERVRDAVIKDARLNALLIGGSFIHGGLDVWSDLDLIIVVEDAAYQEVLASRVAFAEGVGDLLSAFTGEHVGEPRLLICLYGPPLIHLDLKFALAAALEQQVERSVVLFCRDPDAMGARLAHAHMRWPNMSPAWFEARAWIWLHYAITKLARGELYEAIGLLSFFRERVLGPLLYRRAGQNQRGVRRVESLGLDAPGALAATVASHDAVAVRSAIKASIALYVSLRSDAPPEQVVDGMPALLFELMGEPEPGL